MNGKQLENVNFCEETAVGAVQFSEFSFFVFFFSLYLAQLVVASRIAEHNQWFDRKLTLKNMLQDPLNLGLVVLEPQNNFSRKGKKK